MMRTYVILDRTRLALFCLVGGYIICFAPSFIYFFLEPVPLNTTLLGYIAVIKKMVQNLPLEEQYNFWTLSTCYAPGVPSTLGSIMVSSLVYETVLVAVMVWHLRGEVRSPGAVTKLYYDGIMYYFLMLVCLVGAAVGCYYNDWTRSFVASRYFIGFKAMLCSRMILRLRWSFSSRERQALIRLSTDPDTMIETGSDIVFAQPDKVQYTTTVDSGPDLVKSRRSGISGEVRIVEAGEAEDDEECRDLRPRLSLRSLGEAWPMEALGTGDEEAGFPIAMPAEGEPG